MNALRSIRARVMSGIGSFLCFGLVSVANAATLVSGPMAGPPAMRAASVWVQTDEPAEVRLTYWASQTPDQQKSISQRTAAPENVANLRLALLEPGVQYQYQIAIAGVTIDRVFSLKTDALWQWRTNPPNYRVVLGSCAYTNEARYDRPGKPYGSGDTIFERMAEQTPDLTLWLGDNIYFREVDFDSPEGMAHRYRHYRQQKPLQRLLTIGAHAAVWDDHDYGPNDANASFELKPVALDLFKAYWANPTYGMPEFAGISTRFKQSDVEFFLVDGRYHRDDNRLEDPNKTQFGAAQLRWLKNALLSSSATFKLIVSGSQWLSKGHPYEGWHRYPQERAAFIDWLTAQKIPGVLFVSGDRHHTEMLRWERSTAYPLYELTCSPLTSGTHDVSQIANRDELVPGTLVGDRNFCVMDFSGARTDRSLVIKSLSSEGHELWRKELRATELK